MTKKDKHHVSALKVQGGIEQPSSFNVEAVHNFSKKKKELLGVDVYVKGILQGNITILSQAITLVESSLPEHYKVAQAVIAKCLPHSGKAVRIGITGVPGVGKSTFIEALGKYITSQGRKLAVLAIDPSSERSKGSILGDKTRMEELSIDVNAFIRPSPSAGSLGGVARKTRETIILCEAAGFDTIFVETVGVGQSEIAVHSMVDFFLLLMLAGAGDELQGIKRGIMEMADMIAINKADGDNLTKAKTAKVEYENALHLFPPKDSSFTPLVDICSSTTKKGIDRVWNAVSNYVAFTKKNKYFEKNRLQQAKYAMYDAIQESLKNDFYSNKNVTKLIASIEKEVLSSTMSPYIAAQKIMEAYLKDKQ